jgi:rhamnosyltransferase
MCLNAAGTGVAMTSVIAVITVFNAPDDLQRRSVSLLEQLDGVVLVDDGSNSIGDLPSVEGVERILLPENRGIAHALNVGVRRARERGATHLLLLDQDSEPPAGYVDLLMTRLASSDVPAVAVPEEVGDAPILRDRHTGEAFDPIQSGQLLPIEVYDRVGEFAERYFIDAVDSEFRVRAGSLGVPFLPVAGASLAHSLGDLVPLSVFGRPLRLRGRTRHVLYHAPFRTYYMVRNSVALWREQAPGHRRWMMRRSWKLAEMVVGCALLAPDAPDQVRAIVAGLADAVRNRSGRIPTATLHRVSRRRRRRS